jgi:hypothetical protein
MQAGPILLAGPKVIGLRRIAAFVRLLLSAG